MPNVVKIAIIDNTEVVKIATVDGADGKNGVDGKDGKNGVDWSNVLVNGIGQVTGEITLTTNNIPDYTDKRYVTDAELAVIGNTIGTNTGDETDARIGDIVNGSANYVTPLDADKIGIWDTANALFKAVTWANIKATLKAYFDSIYKATFTENTAFNKNFGTTAGTVAEGSTVALKTVQVTSQTLVAANWSLVGGLYEYNLANAGITTLNFVEVIPDNATIAITKAADLMPTNVSSAGSVKLYATNSPTGNIVVTINIYE